MFELFLYYQFQMQTTARLVTFAELAQYQRRNLTKKPPNRKTTHTVNVDDPRDTLNTNGSNTIVAHFHAFQLPAHEHQLLPNVTMQNMASIVQYAILVIALISLQH